jgi:cytochrome c-type biogenesis protein
VTLLALEPSGLALVFSAGVLALFSPCSFPMLPGYVSYYVGAKASPRRIISAGVACTLGILAVFSAIGLAASALRVLEPQRIPLLELAAGLMVISMGAIMAAELKFPAPFVVSRAPRQGGLIGAFLYGVAYGLAASSCSAPIFLSVILYAVVAGGSLGPLHGAITFVVYAIGMGIPIIAVTILAAKAKRFILERMVEMTPRLQRVSGIVLIMIGAYLIYSYYLAFYLAV